MKENISVVYITKNAQRKLEQSLLSICFADEIVIVDSGSTDQTLEIAKKYSAKIIHQEWLGFGKQKQFAVDKAQNDWVLCLDDDEIVSKELSDNIQNVLKHPQYMAYQFARSNYFINRFLKHGEGYPDYSLRLFNKKYAHWSEDNVHEYIVCHKKVETLKGDLLHYSCDSLEEYLNKQNQYTSIQADILSKQKNIGSLKIIMSPFFRFIKFYFIKRGFLDGLPGFIHILIGCFNSMIKYAKVYEQQKGKKE
ncbi:glycosyltransferase family 2 protein [Neisseria sp. Ec49-e6-T10]|uniref:glycosyltransferase family 2 protein n=1 Tax=Neisseria sp. Ec49-e6-T10 TaxID=3140744 RepID=UPI003EBC725D